MGRIKGWEGFFNLGCLIVTQISTLRSSFVSSKIATVAGLYQFFQTFFLSSWMRAIVLGSGLTKFSESFEVVKRKTFEDALNVSFSKLDGHQREFIWCRHAGEEFLVISGKFHFYEGHCFDELVAPLRYAIEMEGVDEVVVTSASGGVSDRVRVGEWAAIRQVVCIPEVNIGNPNAEKYQSKVSESDFDFGDELRIRQVTYAYHQGPSLGTLAEYKMLNLMGVDLVGMSMFPEYCFFRNRGVKACFLSIPVCNYFPFHNLKEPSFEEVIEISDNSIPLLVQFYKHYLTRQNSN